MKLFTCVSFLAISLAAVQAVDWSKLVDIPEHPSGRITGGVEVPPHLLPYQVGLFIEVDGGTAFCGGSLISETVVLTAAHCAEPGSSFEVVLGAHYIRDTTEPSQVRLVTSEKHVHPRWSSLTLLNDLALLILPEAVTFNENIAPIRLPAHADETNYFIADEALMSGWGKQTDDATSISDTLQAINKTVISQAACSPYYFGVISQSAHICTSGSNGQSTCNGDSGGPLVHREEDGKFTQIGIVSFGIAFGCEVGWPPVFTRVTSYLQWIEETSGVVIRPA